MPKLKTHKATSKRIRKTKKGKILKKKTGQSHFNARESGKKTRQKRKRSDYSKVEKKTLDKLTPFC